MKTGIIVLMVVALSACRPGAKKENPAEPVQNSTAETVSDGTSLFDGKTLDGWEITGFGTQGPVSVSEGNIVLGFGDGCTGVTFKKEFPKIDYEVLLEAKKVSGNDFFCGMTFPVNETWCSLIVGGWGGPVVGLSTIDGADASDNDTKVLKNFERNRWYNIRLKVTAEKIEAWIDGEKLVDFVIGNHQLSIRPEVDLSRPFGITSWNTTAALRNIRVKEL